MLRWAIHPEHLGKGLRLPNRSIWLFFLVIIISKFSTPMPRQSLSLSWIYRQSLGLTIGTSLSQSVVPQPWYFSRLSLPPNQFDDLNWVWQPHSLDWLRRLPFLLISLLSLAFGLTAPESQGPHRLFNLSNSFKFYIIQVFSIVY